MKTIILAGGWGTRLGRQTEEIPKPMVPIGNRPILWHIMKIYSCYGFNDFIISCGVKAHVLKNYFVNYDSVNEDFTIDMVNQKIEYHSNHNEKDWKVTLIDTGLNTLKGARIKRVVKYLADDINMVTYGDGVGDINIKDLIKFHKTQGTLATVTSVQPPGRFGSLDIEHGKITAFKEKPQGEGSSINGGFFVLSPRIIDYISNDNTVWEDEPLEKLAQEGQLSAFQHKGFWQPMDTLRDKIMLNELWASGKAPWKVWE